jgi:hypothetical protein
MAAVLAFDTSVTSKILPGGKGVVGSLFQALTGTMSSYEHISTGNFHFDGYPASVSTSFCFFFLWYFSGRVMFVKSFQYELVFPRMESSHFMFNLLCVSSLRDPN